MSEQSDDLNEVVIELLAEFGQPVVITRQVDGDFNPDDGEDTEATSSTFDAVGFIDEYSDNLTDGSRIKSNDKKLLIEATNKPQIDDVITTLDGDAIVVRVKRTGINGVAVLYELQLRY